jgi:hypothetical protein
LEPLVLSTEVDARLPGRPIHHIAYIVDDIPAAAAMWAQTFGAGPFLTVVRSGGEAPEQDHDGGPAIFRPTVAFGQWGPIAVELLRIDAAEPATLAAHFKAPFNHVAYVSETPAEDSEQLAALGLPRFLHSRRGDVETIWHAVPALGHAIEIHRATASIKQYFAAVASAAEGWDGSELLREFRPS